jgi:hypothetical protein
MIEKTAVYAAPIIMLAGVSQTKPGMVSNRRLCSSVPSAVERSKTNAAKTHREYKISEPATHFQTYEKSDSLPILFTSDFDRTFF